MDLKAGPLAYSLSDGRVAVVGIRAVLIGVSPMLRDIVKQCVGSERDIEIIGEFLADDDREPLRLLKPEVVIISLARGEADDVADRLLETAPTARIIALSSDNRVASCRMMRAHKKVISDFSLREIAEFIYGAQ